MNRKICIFMKKKYLHAKLNGDMSYIKKYITNYTNVDMKKSC